MPIDYVSTYPLSITRTRWLRLQEPKPRAPARRSILAKAPSTQRRFGGSRAEARRRREELEGIRKWNRGLRGWRGWAVVFHQRNPRNPRFPFRTDEDSAWGKPTPPTPPRLRASARENSSLLRFAPWRLCEKIPPIPSERKNFGGSRAEARRRREDSARESGPQRNGCGPSQFTPGGTASTRFAACRPR